MAARIVLRAPLRDPSRLPSFVEDCLRDGVTLIAVVGEGCAPIEDEIDALIVGDGSKGHFIATTSHPDETIDDVMAFAKMWDGGGAVEMVEI